MNHSPPQPDAHAAALRRCALAIQQGDLAEADRLCRRLLSVRPGDPEALHLHGLIAHRQGDGVAARSRLRQAVQTRPGVARFRNSLGVVLRELEEPREARAALRKAVALRPGFAGAWYNLGLTCEDLGDHRSALEAYEKACDLASDMVAAHDARGLVLQALGRLEEAREAFERAIAVEHAHGPAHFHLAHARRAEAGDDPQVAAIEALLAERDLPPRQEAWLQAALGKLYDDLGSYDRAFRAQSRANRLTAPAHDPDARDDLASRLIRAFDEARMRRGTPSALRRADRVFIVGPPRSGSTLFETLLAAHPDVEAGGESKELLQVLAALAGSTGPRELDAWARLGDDELSPVARELDRHLVLPEHGRLRTNKLPGNVWHLGLIGLLMPGAPIVFTWRDPRDTGISCFFTRFEEGQTFSYDLYHCGRYLRSLRRLMDHWLSVLPNPVLQVDYEDLVADPEGTLRQARATCGLRDLRTGPDPTRGAAAVTTASNWQVRQRIYSRSIGRWRNYSAHLDPLIEGLGALGRETGTGPGRGAD